VVNPAGEVFAEQGTTPAEAMDKMKAFLVERGNNG
jgi:hypothetical protein